MADLLTAQEALARIDECRASSIRVLGLDGFQMVPEGRMARLDLILDLSSFSRPPASIDEDANEAANFVLANSRPDILWEVVADDG